MNVLLIFFALPVATVILAIVFQKILGNPLLVAATFFAIYLIVTFAAFDAGFLVYAILYTILAYVTAVLTRLICKLINIFICRSNTAQYTTTAINSEINAINLPQTTNIETTANMEAANNNGRINNCRCRRR